MQGCRPGEAPTLSPDGAFVALFLAEGAKLKIRAVRSGQLMLARAVRVPRKVQAQPRVKYATSIQWTTDGRVVISVSARDLSCCLCERVLVVKLV